MTEDIFPHDVEGTVFYLSDTFQIYFGYISDTFDKRTGALWCPTFCNDRTPPNVKTVNDTFIDHRLEDSAWQK